MENKRILIKYASRSRPELFFRGLDSIFNLALDKDNIRIVGTFDYDDPTMNNEQVISRMKTYKGLYYNFGVSKNKIDAINRNLFTLPAFDILINFSDDQIFTALHWDNVVRTTMNRHYPDTDGVLHFPDSKTNAALMTMSIMGNAYFMRFNYIYHPDYVSLYADNEAMDTARILGKYSYVPIDIFKHLHPVWKLAEWDEQYKKSESFYNHDGETYRKRKLKNFDLI